jgi:hypothetical protein
MNETKHMNDSKSRAGETDQADHVYGRTGWNHSVHSALSLSAVDSYGASPTKRSQPRTIRIRRQGRGRPGPRYIEVEVLRRRSPKVRAFYSALGATGLGPDLAMRLTPRKQTRLTECLTNEAAE